MIFTTAAATLSTLLDPPDQRARAEALLRGLDSIARASTADELWWRRRGPVSAQEARRLRAAFVLHGLVLAQAPSEPFEGPHDAARAVASLGTTSREELWALTVDTGLRLISRTRVAAGGRASCSVGPGEVLRIAVVDQAAGLFLVHNHPSGDPQPSTADARFTARVRRGAVSLGIRLHDHIVVAGDRWVSELTGTRGRLSPEARRRKPID